jgi:UDP-glucose 4-epimerase
MLPSAWGPSSTDGRRGAPRVLVLGGTGFLGSEIASEFLASGAAVTILARNAPSDARSKRLEDANMVLGAVEDPEALNRALLDVDHVVHAVGSSLPAESARDPAGDHARTIPGLILLLETLRSHAGVGLTFLSSGGTVYGNPPKVPVTEDAPCDPVSPYGITKLTAEKYIRMYSELHRIRSRILRVSNPYGPWQSAARGQGVIAAFLELAITGKPAHIFGDGSVVRDYVDVADVARAVVDLARRVDGPQVLNVGSGVGHSITAVLEIVQQVTGATLAVDRQAERTSDVRSIVLDVSALEAMIDWQPAPLESGVARTWDQIRWAQGRFEGHPA